MLVKFPVWVYHNTQLGFSLQLNSNTKKDFWFAKIESPFLYSWSYYFTAPIHRSGRYPFVLIIIPYRHSDWSGGIFVLSVSGIDGNAPKRCLGIAWWLSSSPLNLRNPLSLKETLIKSLSDFTLEFLCIARNNLTRIASYLRKVMTKLCIKILVKSDSAI